MSVGIGLQGDFEAGQPTDAQLETLQWLVVQLLDYYQLDRTAVVGNNELPGRAEQQTSTDPGRNFLPLIQAFRAGTNFWPR